MKKVKPSWHNPVPSMNPPKSGPVPAGGYTKPDYVVRCKKCGVGKHPETGEMVGTPIAVYIVSAGLPDGGSVAVARVPICYKCREILPFDILPGGTKYGIKGFNIIRCLKARQGLLATPWFTLEELLTGKIDQAMIRPLIEQTEPIEQTELVDPGKMEEQDSVLF